MANSAEVTRLAGVSALSRRTDLRLVPAVLVTWSVALAGAFIDATWSAAVAGVFALAGGLLLVGARRHRPALHRARTVPATIALACILGAVVAVDCAVMANTREEGPLAEAVAEGSGVLIHVLITGVPTEVRVPGHASGNRWSVDAALVEVTSKGSVIQGSADLVIVGGNGWQDVRPGQRVRTSGTIKAVREGQTQAALLSASSAPVVVASTLDIRQSVADVRRHFIEASGWLPPDPAGLMPGMVTGDTSALPESLEADMKTTGMTHLTAVSGANCSLVLGGFILLARCLRLTRPVAGIFAACGLAAFVVMVGPEPSVLRAAVMGTVGLAALIGGLRGRSLTFLCLATIVLLLLDPSMAANVGFLLSVLATLGIVLLATRVASWIPVWVPRWLAAGVAVPLSAQLLCGPVIVALQPQFTPYAFIANVVAGILVAPVTVFGTLAVPLAVGLPWLAAVPIAVAGTCAGVVAGVARFFAHLPGAALPWAEGPAGIVSMVAFSMMTLLLVWVALHPMQAIAGIVWLHDAVVVILDRWPGKRVCGRGTTNERQRGIHVPQRLTKSPWRKGPPRR
ncbi:competence protein ComEC [Paenarthrobacter nitroguajacolicus]|uniref:ComEC/Rec2 family competence protein n=1 Tax=Paenarthrobacter nitroguajacolicus TaxID=211146 RepID=UPI0015BCFD4D|nr:ComEC/Rec2 family competence protein [Paenarthrobacter nitroguajacolicus]NWL09767.1 competence protein ComEC [Paenarthrobacter nitroguajacolicus]